MKITLRALRKRPVQRLVIESVDLSLYIAYAELDGCRYLVTDRDGRPLRTPNLLSMKERLAAIDAAERVLVQRSAYDEMVGSRATGDNSLEIPLRPGYESLPRWEH
jgi:hypothetical protein